MATCRSCGTDNVEGAAFCDSCGISLTPGTGAQQPAAPAQPPMARAGSACPACGGSVMPGEAFCDSCGATLNSPIPSGASGAQPAYAPAAQPAAYAPRGAPTLRATMSARVRLLIQPSGEEITLPEQPEVIIGRADTSSQFFPDIDLNRFDALGSGVSRRHARVTAHAGQVAIEDLDTANGTVVNKQRLAPRQLQPLGDGDELRFGALVMLVRLG
jgi:hypothetical protein